MNNMEPGKYYQVPCKPKIVSTVIYKEQLIVATENGVFKLVDDQLIPIKFIGVDNEAS